MEKNIEISYQEFDDWHDLESDLKELVVKANEACKNAYAPYSEFSVGAAVKLSNGDVIIGSNQENIAYPSGLCAERVALFSKKRVEKLLLNPAIVRNRLKVESAVTNAQAFIDVQEEFGSFSKYIWDFVDGTPIQNKFKKGKGKGKVTVAKVSTKGKGKGKKTSAKPLKKAAGRSRK